MTHSRITRTGRPGMIHRGHTASGQQSRLDLDMLFAPVAPEAMDAMCQELVSHLGLKPGVGAQMETRIAAEAELTQRLRAYGQREAADALLSGGDYRRVINVEAYQENTRRMRAEIAAYLTSSNLHGPHVDYVRPALEQFAQDARNAANTRLMNERSR